MKDRLVVSALSCATSEYGNNSQLASVCSCSALVHCLHGPRAVGVSDRQLLSALSPLLSGGKHQGLRSGGFSAPYRRVRYIISRGGGRRLEQEVRVASALSGQSICGNMDPLTRHLPCRSCNLSRNCLNSFFSPYTLV